MSNFDSGLGDAFKSVENEMKKVAEKIREEAKIQTIDDTKKRIAELKLNIKSTLDSLMNSFDSLKSELVDNEKNLTSTLNIKLDSLRTLMAEFRTADSNQIRNLSEQITNVKADIKEISQRKIQIPDFASQINKIESDLKKEISALKSDDKQSRDFQKKIDKIEQDFIDLRKKAMSALASHGGNANRNILVSNNPSTLGRYTDLNIKPGNNITLTYVNNDNLKTTDLTIAASGGGTSRNISTVSVSSVVAATASTDIVIIASAGIKLTMPTAVSNTNLYTIKNTSTSSVLVVANGSETIDGSANITLTTQYTSVDLISDNSNFQVT